MYTFGQKQKTKKTLKAGSQKQNHVNQIIPDLLATAGPLRRKILNPEFHYPTKSSAMKVTNRIQNQSLYTATSSKPVMTDISRFVISFPFGLLIGTLQSCSLTL